MAPFRLVGKVGAAVACPVDPLEMRMSRAICGVTNGCERCCRTRRPWSGCGRSPAEGAPRPRIGNFDDVDWLWHECCSTAI